MTAVFPKSSTSQNKLWAERTPYILLLNFLFFKPLQMTNRNQRETLENELDRVGKRKPETHTQREREKKGGKQLHKSISCVFFQHVYYVYNQDHFAGDSSTLFQALAHLLFVHFILFFLNEQHQAFLFLASADKKLKPSQLA